MSTEEHIAQLTAQVAALQAQLAHCSWSPPPPQPSAAPVPTPNPPKAGTPPPFCLEVVPVVMGPGDWAGGPNVGGLRGGGRGGTSLGGRWGPGATSKLGLEGCNLCCQLGDVLLSGHGGVLARGLQGLSFFYCQGVSKTGSICDVRVPAELQCINEGSLKGNRSLLNA